MGVKSEKVRSYITRYKNLLVISYSQFWEKYKEYEYTEIFLLIQKEFHNVIYNINPITAMGKKMKYDEESNIQNEI